MKWVRMHGNGVHQLFMFSVVVIEVESWYTMVLLDMVYPIYLSGPTPTRPKAEIARSTIG